MLARSATVALALLVSTQAHAICSQGDLAGVWRFEFNTGIVRSDTNRVQTMSCLLRIKGNGAIVPRRCDPVDSSGEEGAFVTAGNRKFRMNLNNCEVRISSSSPSFGLQWIDGGDVLTRHFTNARLSISKDRQMMLGWLSNAGTPIMTVIALKRARP